MIRDHVVFSSARFAVEPGEDGDTNPGIYGKALAAWVADGLRQRGVAVEATIAEDFGRCVMVRQRPYRLWVACANLDGSTTRWQTFIALEQGLMARFFGSANSKIELARLRGHMRSLIQESPDVKEVEWQDN
jgi:hypothetical protein